MPWTYEQKTGRLLRDGAEVGHGYSGHDLGKNNPDLEGLRAVGPIPRGVWTIKGPPRDTATHGPAVLDLEPANGTDTLGRSGFLIHGDSLSAPGTASHGCIILPPAMRRAVWDSGDRVLIVVSGEATP